MDWGLVDANHYIHTYIDLFILFYCLFAFSRAAPRHMEVPRLRVESEL